MSQVEGGTIGSPTQVLPIGRGSGEESHPRVIVFGSAHVDRQVTVRALPKPGQTVHALAQQVGPGGKGLNQAVGAARSGVRTVFVGAVGQSEANYLLEAELANTENLEAHVSRLTDIPTSEALVFTDQDGENFIAVLPGAAHLSSVCLSDLAEMVKPNDILLMQLEVPLAAVQEALQIANQQGIPTVLNPSPYHDISRFRGMVSHLIVNQHEAAEACLSLSIDYADVDSMLMALADSFGATVTVTLGDSGCRTWDGHCIIATTAERVEVRDTTGAGDAFAGAFTASLALGYSLESSLAWATHVGGQACRKVGATNYTVKPLQDICKDAS